MRDLTVDSTMLGQVVHVAGSADGRLASGAHIPVTDDLPLTLVAAPTYVEIDALMEDARGTLQASVRVGPAAPGLLHRRSALGVGPTPSRSSSCRLP